MPGFPVAALYLPFNEGDAATAAAAIVRHGLSTEAIRLARVLANLLPDEPEATGLLSLMLPHDARRGARIDAAGDLVPLADPERSRWDGDQIGEGSHLLEVALRLGRPGPYQVQAAIAACHVTADGASTTDWAQIAALYGELARHLPPRWWSRTEPWPWRWPTARPPGCRSSTRWRRRGRRPATTCYPPPAPTSCAASDVIVRPPPPTGRRWPPPTRSAASSPAAWRRPPSRPERRLGLFVGWSRRSHTEKDSTPLTASRSTRAWVLVLTSVASMMATLDVLIIAAALTTIQRDLGATIEQLEWTVNAYNLSFAVLLMTGAALGDRFGRRRRVMSRVRVSTWRAARAACGARTGSCPAAWTPTAP